VEKVIKEMKDKKARDDDIPVDVLKLLGEDGLKLLTYMKLKTCPRISLKL